MSNLTSVGITSGVPTSGTGTVSTIDALMAVVGALNDSKSTNPDAASATTNAILRGIEQKIIDGTIAPSSAAAANSLSIVNPTDQAVAVSLDTSRIALGTSGTLLTPKFAKISTSSTSSSPVAAVTSKKIRVLQWIITGSAAVNFKWQSHTTPTDLTGLFYIASAGGGAGGSFNPAGHFETLAGEALDLSLSSGVAVGGYVVYVEV